MTPLRADEARAVRLLAQGASREEVEAVCLGVDVDDPRIVDAVAWARGTANAERLTPAYVKLRMMEAVEETHEVEEPNPDDPEGPPRKVTRPALDAKDRARLLSQIAKMK